MPASAAGVWFAAAMARLFVAVWPPSSVVEAVAREVPRPPGPGLRWVPPENWHVTLRFLGRADPDDAARALDGLAANAAEAVVGPAVTMLGRAIVCLPVAGLDRLAAAVVAATAGVGQPPEGRRFNGHLTLARRKGRASAPTGAPSASRFEVDEVALVESHTEPSGAEYRTLRTWPLATPRPT